jgi:hypothetical protein
MFLGGGAVGVLDDGGVSSIHTESSLPPSPCMYAFSSADFTGTGRNYTTVAKRRRLTKKIMLMHAPSSWKKWATKRPG